MDTQRSSASPAPGG